MKVVVTFSSSCDKFGLKDCTVILLCQRLRRFLIKFIKLECLKENTYTGTLSQEQRKSLPYDFIRTGAHK